MIDYRFFEGFCGAGLSRQILARRVGSRFGYTNLDQ